MLQCCNTIVTERKNKRVMKVGDKIQLPANKKDLFLNKVGGLDVEILEIEALNELTVSLTVKILCTGKTTVLLCNLI